jgi:hypothetical protein
VESAAQVQVALPHLLVAVARPLDQPLRQEVAESHTPSTYTATTFMYLVLDQEISVITPNCNSLTRLVVTWLCFLVVDGS